MGGAKDIEIPVDIDGNALTITIRIRLTERERRSGQTGDAPGSGVDVLEAVRGALATAPPDLQMAVRTLLSNDRPPRTVAGWARSVGMSRSTLWRRWALHMARVGRPTDFLRSVLASRAREMARRGISRTAAARALKLDVRTVKALCDDAGRTRGRPHEIDLTAVVPDGKAPPENVR